MLANRKQTERLGFETLLLSINKLDSIEQKKVTKSKEMEYNRICIISFPFFFPVCQTQSKGVSVIYNCVLILFFLKYKTL